MCSSYLVLFLFETNMYIKMENKPQFFTNALNISFCGAKTGNMHLKCVRIINFARFTVHTNILFNSDKLLKFQDIIKFEQMKLVFRIQNKYLTSWFK